MSILNTKVRSDSVDGNIRSYLRFRLDECLDGILVHRLFEESLRTIEGLDYFLTGSNAVNTDWHRETGLSFLRLDKSANPGESK